MFVTRQFCGACGSARKDKLWSASFTDPIVWSFINAHYFGGVPKEPFSRAKYELVKCLDCGFIWQLHVLGPEGMDLLYEKWIISEGSCQRKEEADILLFSGYASEVQSLSALLGKKPFQISTFDFGMGWARWCLMAKAFGYRTCGFEVSPARVAYANRLGIEVIAFEEIKKRKFDFINADQVFEHLSDPLETIAMLANALNKGGVLRVAIPNGRGLEAKLRAKTWRPGMDHVDPLEHISSYTRKVFISMAKRAGLDYIAPPLLTPREPGLLPFVRTVIAKLKKQYFGSTFYLKKPI